LGDVSRVATSRSSSKNTRKLNIQAASNIKLFWTNTKSKLVVLGVAGKFVKRCGLPIKAKFWTENKINIKK
jgi:hypothetical protein